MKTTYTHAQQVLTGPQKTVTLTVKHSYEHSAPMSWKLRVAAYQAQNGQQRVSIRQDRAIRKAEKRAVARAAALLGGAR